MFYGRERYRLGCRLVAPVSTRGTSLVRPVPLVQNYPAGLDRVRSRKYRQQHHGDMALCCHPLLLVSVGILEVSKPPSGAPSSARLLALEFPHIPNRATAADSGQPRYRLHKGMYAHFKSHATARRCDELPEERRMAMCVAPAPLMQLHRRCCFNPSLRHR